MSWTGLKDGAITMLSSKGMNLPSRGPDWRLAGLSPVFDGPNPSTLRYGREADG
jgi:hypothetical protein